MGIQGIEGDVKGSSDFQPEGHVWKGYSCGTVSTLKFDTALALKSLLAHLLERISKECEDIQYTLWSQFFYYGFLALNNPAPSIRTHGAKILARLFSDVVVANN